MTPFCQPWSCGEELQYIAQAIENQKGPDARYYTLACERWLEAYTGCQKAFLTPSCTAALEMAAILANIKPGDEVIMPSFTFPAMANAFVLRGGIPIFVDIRPDTLNIDEQLIEAAITPRTCAIVVMHYGGVACEMDSIMALAEKHGLLVIEDAAHAIGATYTDRNGQSRPLGSIGHLAAFSFHKTKNIQCGEGGALLINDRRFLERAEIVREHGTDKAKFNRHEVDQYTWVDIGSSFIMSEFSAAFLWAQLQHIEYITKRRKSVWLQYYSHWLIGSPHDEIFHNAHIFYVLCESQNDRRMLMECLWKNGIQATSHYQPLHNSTAGKLYSAPQASLPQTTKISKTLLRLPLWPSLSESEINRICNSSPLKSFSHPKENFA